MHRPYRVIVYTTASVDGRIGVYGRRLVLSYRCDLERLHYLRSVVDAVVVGANTVLNDNPMLTPRLVKSLRKPYRVVVDPYLKTPVNARVYDTSIAPSVVIVSINAPDLRKREFIDRGVCVIEVGWVGDKLLDLHTGFMELYRRFNVREILVEGGGYLISSLLRLGIVDRIYIAVAPLVLGRGICIARGDVLENPLELELVSISLCKCGREVVLEYRVKNSEGS